MTRLEWIKSRSRWQGSECLKGPFPGAWYHAVKLPTGGWSKAHRLMCEAAHGPAPTGNHHALHSCGNKWCVNPQHLRWGTIRENHQDMARDGVDLRGSRAPRAKLTENDVMAAREDRLRGMTYGALEKKYKIARGAIWHAVNGTQWGHVK